jgi:hypothetical protein
MINRIFFYLLYFILIFNADYCLPQTKTIEKLEMKNGFFGYSYKYGGEDISRKDFESFLNSSEDNTIFQDYMSARSISTIADITAVIGGGCIGFGLASKPTNTTIVIVGAVLGVTSFIIENSADNKLQKTIDRFNSTPIVHNYLPINNLVDDTPLRFEFIIKF